MESTGVRVQAFRQSPQRHDKIAFPLSVVTILLANAIFFSRVKQFLGIKFTITSCLFTPVCRLDYCSSENKTKVLLFSAFSAMAIKPRDLSPELATDID